MSSDRLLAARLRGRPATAATAAVVVLAALAVPPFLPPYWLSILILGVIFAILAMSLNLLMGFTGLDSLGQAAFFGTAAYVLGILTTRYGLGWASARRPVWLRRLPSRRCSGLSPYGSKGCTSCSSRWRSDRCCGAPLCGGDPSRVAGTVCVA